MVQPQFIHRYLKISNNKGRRKHWCLAFHKKFIYLEQLNDRILEMGDKEGRNTRVIKDILYNWINQVRLNNRRLKMADKKET